MQTITIKAEPKVKQAIKITAAELGFNNVSDFTRDLYMKNEAVKKNIKKLTK